MCSHSDSNCQLYCYNCEKYYCCRKCHEDDKQIVDHLLIGKNCNKIKCNLCQTEQKPSNKCIKCSVDFAEYICLKCLYFGKKRYYHCNRCGVCYFNPIHECQNSSICLLCNDFMDEPSKLCILHCGRTVHLLCMKQSLIFDDNNCPLCMNYGITPYKCIFCLQNICNNGLKYLRLPCNHDIHLKCSTLCSKFIVDNKYISNNEIFEFYQERQKILQIIKCPKCNLTFSY